MRCVLLLESHKILPMGVASACSQPCHYSMRMSVIIVSHVVCLNACVCLKGQRGALPGVSFLGWLVVQ
jgi:hypothetical protein